MKKMNQENLNREIPVITVLDGDVVDQIAAGEVVERPASIVKELVENALDAGATKITVETEEGGKQKIRVTDNGIGMAPDQIALALQRYATSKIQSAKDLFGLSTMGFRGEALPSIASVSRISITTRIEGALAATCVCAEAGSIVSTSETGAAQGTTVEVTDLFYNTPARRKFLKGNASESTRISATISSLAMAYPDVHFCLRQQRRNAINVPPHNDRMERILALLDPRYRGQMFAYKHEESDVHVTVYIATPSLAQSTSRGIQIYVGQRPVRDRELLHAILMGYGENIPKGRYPTAIVFIGVPAMTVDINVHPQKSEVRFSDSRVVCSSVRHAISRALAKTSWLTSEHMFAPHRLSSPRQERSFFAPGYQDTTHNASKIKATETSVARSPTGTECVQRYKKSD